MFRTTSYSIYFVVLCTVLFVEKFLQLPAHYSVIPALTLSFALAHCVRLSYISLDLHNTECRSIAPPYCEIPCSKDFSDPVLNFIYVTMGVVVLATTGYTHCATMLAGSYVLTRVVYKHLKLRPWGHVKGTSL